MSVLDFLESPLTIWVRNEFVFFFRICPDFKENKILKGENSFK